MWPSFFALLYGELATLLTGRTVEFGAFKLIKDASPKYVLSLDKLDLSRDGIVHLNIEDYLPGRGELVVT